jgi:hypothetical protein
MLVLTGEDHSDLVPLPQFTRIGMMSCSLCDWTPWYFPLTTLAMWSISVTLESARKLLAYPIQRFACGHGAIRQGGTAALPAAIAQAAR